MNEALSYFEWLTQKANITNDENGYSILCLILHETQFYPILEMDENRWEDGTQYRAAFTNDDYELDQLDQELGGCTMLELILSLSEKMTYEMSEGPYEAEIGKWFEELLGNLGLEAYVNRELMENGAAYFEVTAILEKLNFRHYRYNGEGGLFPLRYPSEDQRDVELAIQMNNYIMENYDIL